MESGGWKVERGKEQHRALNQRVNLGTKGERMKTIFQAFAKYNGAVNQNIIELIEPLKKDQIMMATKAFYPSIFATLLHNLVADINWLKRYRDVFTENKALGTSPLMSADVKALRTDLESDYTKFFSYRKQADELFVRLTNEIDEGRLNAVIRYKNYKGEEVEKEAWKTLLHLFNHQTHHRGQVSVLLDLVGVDHDFSSLVSRI
jgi:uncharacterized damage-inducible protein DinB